RAPAAAARKSRRLMGSPPPYRSFDDPIGEREKARRDGEADRPGDAEVEREVEFGQTADRQLGRIGALEDEPGVAAGLVRSLRHADAVGQEAAGRGELGE